MKEQLTYRKAGVDSDQQDRAMSRVTDWVERTFHFRPNTVKLPLGYFANVIDIGQGMGLALSSDGVGTKILVAQMMNKFDTVGIDCVAMNVNDVLCLGAEPLALLDYIAVEVPDPNLLDALARGLHDGARLANITIPGGEIAQVKEMIRGVREGSGFDLVATCIGQVPLDRILTGRDLQQGDVVVGLRSSGLHSNGYTLARRIFFDHLKWPIDRYVDEFGCTVGEELLKPTRIYVKEVMAMIRAGLRIKALAHITSTGFLNLSRADAPVGYVIDNLPEPQPVFRLIQRFGGISDEEMFFTYNMGIGFCVIVVPEDVSSVQGIAQDHQTESAVIGSTVSDPEKKVTLPKYGLVGRKDSFYRL